MKFFRKFLSVPSGFRHGSNSRPSQLDLKDARSSEEPKVACVAVEAAKKQPPKGAAESSPARRTKMDAVFVSIFARKCRVNEEKISSLRRRPARSEAERAKGNGFRQYWLKPRWRYLAIFIALAALIVTASAAIPYWIQNIEGRTPIENAIFRIVQLPRGLVTIRRPPTETVSALSELIKNTPHPEQLYSLRALEDEQKLDFSSAEADWKMVLQLSSDKAEAQLALADFYHRRLRPQDEVNALSALGRLPDSPLDERVAMDQRPAWQAFERALHAIRAHMLGKAARDATVAQYQAWMARYPEAPEVDSRYFEYLTAARDFKAAESVAAAYHSKFPKDEIFPVRAAALLAYKQGSVEKALAIYDQNFKPLWPGELVKNYFDLLTTTHTLGRFLERTRTELRKDPNDLNAICKIFFYHQQTGNIGAAQQAVTEYRARKDSLKAAWTSQELYTLAKLLQNANAYPESARYYFALYNSKEMPDAQEKALSGLANILLEAPEQQLNFGAGDLSMYRDIGTMDTGPGYLNGILSLVLNTTSPQRQYAEEEQRAVPYFHRAQAAQLISVMRQKFPNSESLPALHAKLLESYSGYGEHDAVVLLGKEFLDTFPQAIERTQVALLMADAYQAKENTKDEFATYDLLLKELAANAGGVPLGDRIAGITAQPHLLVQQDHNNPVDEDGQDSERESTNDVSNPSDPDVATPLQSAGRALSVQTEQATPAARANSEQYAVVLNRYLSRLAVKNDVPRALAVLREELHRNPNDPGLYEDLAQFLEQNQLGTELEATYRRAMQQFSGKGWYHKLARWYVRNNRDRELGSLLEEVSKSFSGTELEEYFRQVSMPSELTVKLNLYAHARFPHNLTFVRNLLNHYYSEHNYAAWETLIRRHWFEDAGLRSWFFEYLSKSGRLESELAELKLNPKAKPEEWASAAQANPAAVRFAAEAELWRSHFEDSAGPLGAVSALYPADGSLGREASSVYRSLAFFNPKNTERAVQVELNLLAANPQSRDTLARIGDIYADRGQFKLAAPYWNRMTATEAGSPRSYEMAATVFWDYYYFQDAQRLLNQGRANLGDNRLYSYEMGAIYESGHDYPRAVTEYVKGAAPQQEDSPSRRRLMQLAVRPSTADLVDSATLKAATQSGFNLDTVRLRAGVLEAQLKLKQAETFLHSVLDHTTSVEVAEGIEHFAEEKNWIGVHRHALEREVSLAGDSLRRLQLRYELAHFCEDNMDLPAAERNIDSIYRENPRIMGVVRATVDFYWRNKKQQQAIDLLVQAARDSHHELATQFTYEAARKMTEARQFEPARKQLSTLLQESPYNNEYAAAMADTYLHSGDNAGLRDFYLQRIAFFRTADIPREQRQGEIASFRRALVPALTALKDYAGGVDQYIEVINAYPDDEDLSTEAALYAIRHGRKDQLINFYLKTVTDSPKDSRWMVVLARLQTVSEDFRAAIDSFSQAIRIRPDRADLLAARAALEERLVRFDEAANDYATLYERTYHDAQWMEKLAEIRARQGRPDQTVRALQAAFIDHRPETPQNYSAVAEHLERWGMLPQARDFAEQGIAVAGKDLLAGGENHPLAELYVRIMTRLRLQDAAWKTLDSAINASVSLPPVPEPVGNKDANPITEKEWRTIQLGIQKQAAHDGMARCMKAMGATVATYFTPEDKQAFLQAAQDRNSRISRDDAYDYLLPLAKAAGFADLQASLMYESLITKPNIDTHLNELIDLQTRRLKLGELGQQLEHIAENYGENHPEEYLSQASDAYRLAGQPLDELRTLKRLEHYRSWSWLNRQQARLFELLLKYEPEELLARAGRNDKYGDDSANYILAHADMKMVRAALKARSAQEDPVWRNAYTGLAGLYFKDTAPEIRSAFLQALSNQTIGQRVRHPGDRSEEMAGGVWFYYGSRYGEYLEATHQGDPEDWLPAQLEHEPGRSSAYFDSAVQYEDIGDLPHAIDDFQHSLELSPKRVEVHDHLGEIYWGQGRKEEALAEWSKALEALKNQAAASKSDLPESFSEDYSNIADHLKDHRLLSQFHSQLNGLLHTYVKYSEAFGLKPMLQSSLSDTKDPRETTALIMELSRDSQDQLAFLGSFVQPHSKLSVQMEPLYRRILELARQQRTKEAAFDTRYTLREWQIKWFEFLLSTRQYAKLSTEIDSVKKVQKPLFKKKKDIIDGADEDDDQDFESNFTKIQLRLAAATNTLDSYMQSFNDSEHPPSSGLLKKTARDLQKAGDRQSARRILEFVFRREVENRNLNASNMLALAEIRIEDGDLQSAVELMHRMTLVAGAPFETQEPAAALLIRTGHPQEAISFLKELADAAPWNAGYRAGLAQAQIAANVDAEAARAMLAAVATDKTAPYEVRAAGAKSLKQPGSILDLGSRELKLLASGRQVTMEESNQPFFWAARVQASQSLEPAQRTHLLWLALADYPQQDSVRPTLLKIAMQAGDDHLAIAVMQPLLKRDWLDLTRYYRYAGYQNSDDDDDDSDTSEDSNYELQADTEANEEKPREPQEPASLDKLPAKQKAEIARQIGTAFEKLDELPEAIRYLKEASRLEPSVAVRKQIDQQARQLREILDQRKENSSRQPQIHGELEQSNIVRPRLTVAKPMNQRVSRTIAARRTR